MFFRPSVDWREEKIGGGVNMGEDMGMCRRHYSVNTSEAWPLPSPYYSIYVIFIYEMVLSYSS